MGVHQFNNEPIRLMFAALAGTMRSSDSFINTALQKHMFREVKNAEMAVNQREMLSWWPKKHRYGFKGKSKDKMVVGEEDEDEDEVDAPVQDITEGSTQGFIPVRHNPVLVTMYGQMCNVARSYQSAICTYNILTVMKRSHPSAVYLLHAYDWCPQDPVVCLTLGIASLGRAMQRQSDNRHHLVAQVCPIFPHGFTR
jgi:general transcription factor 3C polypeptide 3 (transcription factor C subunit 4)